MLFVTNRVFREGLTPVNTGDNSFKLPRSISFNLNNNQAEQSVYFCRRKGPETYSEVGSYEFFNELKQAKQKQILFYIHGFDSLPESAIFPRAQELQELFDRKHQENVGAHESVLVVPIIWPCDNDHGQVNDYFDDQKAADASDFAYMRMFEKFLNWRREGDNLTNPCTKRINILSHSMGNRVLRGALKRTVQYYQPEGLPLIFRNIFMTAPDVVNETLESGQEGEFISQTARNVVVYFAADDLALRASKIANLRSSIASRRLGHTGPENLEKAPKNIYAVDCDDFNRKYDSPAGHGYFAKNPQGNPGAAFNHIWTCIQTGRVPGDRVQILTDDAT
ncbi:MAG: alpha/beta hydrolase [Leptolyngbyaceae cyanobacterium MO_188.B28]|nr:alpha/beta hydrolase [Leptolyngbyaceae cyanobacterium MO_188.B28]